MSLNIHIEEISMTKVTLFKIEAILVFLMGIPAAIAIGQIAVALGSSTVWGWLMLVIFWGATIGWWGQGFPKTAGWFMFGLFFVGLWAVWAVGFDWIAVLIFLFTLMAGVTANKNIAT